MLEARLAGLLKGIRETLRGMMGIPDYQQYLSSWQEQRSHEGRPMTYEEFFRDRQERRFGNDAQRCC